MPISYPNSSVKFNHRAHKKLWLWLARNPGKTKSQWPGWKPDECVTNNCFACEAGLSRLLELNITDKTTYCYCCPFGDFSNTGAGDCLGGLHNKWVDVFYIVRENPKDRILQRLLSHLAKRIALMPLREELQ